MVLFLIIFIMLDGIAAVVDLMLTHTFPAFTLIVAILVLGSYSLLLYWAFAEIKRKINAEKPTNKPKI